MNPPVLHTLDIEHHVDMVEDAEFELVANHFGVCKHFLKGSCPNGNRCRQKHQGVKKDVVCKHWLRGLCKKNELCEFLHEYILAKMPECQFFMRDGQECTNSDCLFIHRDPEEKRVVCPWYNRGFCASGPNCKMKHVRRVMCDNYLAGFCPYGPACPYAHPVFDPNLDEKMRTNRGLTCHLCGQPGHKRDQCPQRPEAFGNRSNAGGKRGPPDEVTCYRCNEKGHKANVCPNKQQQMNDFVRYGNREPVHRPRGRGRGGGGGRGRGRNMTLGTPMES